jgi:hypothetical protein
MSNWQITWVRILLYLAMFKKTSPKWSNGNIFENPIFYFLQDDNDIYITCLHLVFSWCLYKEMYDMYDNYGKATQAFFVGMSRQFRLVPSLFWSMLQLPDAWVELVAYADKICSYVSGPGLVWIWFSLEVHPTNRKWMVVLEKGWKRSMEKGWFHVN